MRGSATASSPVSSRVCVQTSRSAAARTISNHAALAVSDVNGIRSRPQSLRFLIRFSTWPWRTVTQLERDWVACLVGEHDLMTHPVVAPQAQLRARMGTLTTHDRPGPGGPAIDADVEFGDLGETLPRLSTVSVEDKIERCERWPGRFS